MNDESSKSLNDVRFKRLVGVERKTVEKMGFILEMAYQTKHARGDRKPKMSLEDLLMVTLQYISENTAPMSRLRLILAYTKAT